MKRETREWVGKAEDDYQLAVLIASGSQSFHDQLCFHCQQSAEKYLKAILEEMGVTIPKIHDLGRLLNMLTPTQPSLGKYRRGLVFLSNFSVPMRYPGANATKRQAKAALRWAERVREAVRPILGIKVKKQK